MNRGRDDVADQYESPATPYCRDRLIDDSITEPIPEEDLASYLEISMPPCGAFFRSLPEQEVFPAEAVEVEPTEGEDRIVKQMLKPDHKFAKAIVCHDTVMIGTFYRCEKAV